MLKSSKIDEMLKSKTKCTLRPVSDTPRPIACNLEPTVLLLSSVRSHSETISTQMVLRRGIINDVMDCGLLRNILGIWVWKSQDLTFGHPFARTMCILLVGRPQMTLLYCHPGQLKKHRLALRTAQNMD